MADKEGKALGGRIRRLRRQAGLSQAELGDKLGVSYQQIQKYERGVSRLSVEALLRLAKALERPVGVFLPAGTYLQDAALEAESRFPPFELPRHDYSTLSKEEKDLLKAFRDLADDKLRAAFLTTLKAAARKP